MNFAQALSGPAKNRLIYSPRARSIGLAVLAARALTACGGGGGGGGGGDLLDLPSPISSYFSVQGLPSNGAAVYTACINGSELVDPKTTKGQAITNSMVNYYALSNWTAEAGTGKTCAEKYPFANATVTVDFYNSKIAGAPAPNSGGSGASTGTPPSPATPSTGNSGTGDQYSSWNGSVNGSTINDGNDEHFKAISGSGQLVSSNGSALTGLVLVNGPQLSYQGAVIGYVGLAPAAAGGQLAKLYCSDNSYLDITVAAGKWTYACAGASGAGASSGSGNTSGGGSSSSSSGAPVRAFISWSGSSNNEVVLDANDEHFRFYADSHCIYSDNTQTEYSNFCLSTSGNTVNFKGQTYSVSSIRSTSNRCITAITTSQGFMADVYSGSKGIEYITESTKKPQPC